MTLLCGVCCCGHLVQGPPPAGAPSLEAVRVLVAAPGPLTVLADLPLSSLPLSLKTSNKHRVIILNFVLGKDVNFQSPLLVPMTSGKLPEPIFVAPLAGYTISEFVRAAGVPQAGRLEQQTYFLTGGLQPEVRCWQDWFLPRPLSPLPCVFPQSLPSSARLHVLIFL